MKNFTVDGNSGNFDYINFLKKDNIFYEIKQPKIVFLQKYQGNYIKEKLFIFKKKIIQQIKKILPEPESSLLAGILIGAKEDMGKELLEEFRETGIIHIVVLSGFNLTILAQFIMIILSVFGRKVSAIFGSLSIILFAIMTGASATIVRASLMALLVILARVLGRSSEAVRLLFLAGFIMLIFNPMLLLYDASFQLSFLATLGLLVLSPKIEDFIKYGNFKIFNLKEILGATLSTQIFVFPLLLYLMGEISIISPLVNILILILVPFSMLLGIVTIAISFINFELGLIFSYANYLILSYDLTVVHYFSDLDFSTFQ
ncbi:MAG TPA: ComEC/Rec2 family competence protein [Candidatus Pacebacteria bacterium]|nr:ComEC/Rec2 family competence protein [Candidatus Paceibacterota bacterium]HIP33496.1 ComEC/Rec2 family competence protein [Bacteroidia bacterium]